ncbi:right-handed parallel beta-helix repeat-containing protein [Bacillus atrophaeus]|uniref:right-handed parallel beta-helix repeat-containing protein n=1 Tax=Bacillus atrophaeus TaxID=1452 RepID=UPI0022828DCE|nr:right-handed parallel beta-helix repeat-containing protein [Bacillus atrophaeus]MCY8920230.1 right-handed parallel beta-helix repeat-containing protein [Bacillus atrophaeus]
MTNVLLQRVGAVFDRIFCKNLNENFDKIEDGFLELTKDLNAHKSASTAHNSRQISHGVFDVGNRIDNLNARFTNLLVNHDGTDVKEVVDLRVALDATTHSTAKDRVDYDFKLLYKRLELLPEVNVLDYGADPTGKVDAAPAIQAALDLAKNGDGVRIYIPKGCTFKLAAPLIFWENTLVIAKDATLLNYFGDHMGVNGDGSVQYSGYEGNGNIIIDGGTWDCRGLQIEKGTNCFSFGHGRDIYVKNVTIKDVRSYHGIEFNSCHRFGAFHCNFLGFFDPDGTRSFSEAIQIDLAQRPGVFGPFGRYDFTVCKDGSITGCYFGASGTPGTQAWPRGVGSHSSTIGYWHENISVRDNTFDGTTGWAVRGYNWNTTNISGNTLRNCHFGITISAIDPTNPGHTLNDNFEQLSKSQDFRDVTIQNNRIYDTVENEAIYIRGFFNNEGIVRNVVITGNIINSVGGSNQAGIRLDAVNGGIIANNQISDTSGDGVRLNDCMGINVSGANEISFVGRDAIAAFGSCSDLLISGNLIRQPRRYGIEQSHVCFAVITGNLITGAGQSDEGAYEAIRVASGSKRILIAGNMCRSIPTLTTLARAGIYITSSVAEVVRYGNDCRGSWTVGGIVDNSADSKTDAKDVI